MIGGAGTLALPVCTSTKDDERRQKNRSFHGADLSQSQRDWVPQPGVARDELPWVTTIPRVVATLQPWALIPNPVGVLMDKIQEAGSTLFPALQDV